MTTRLIDVDITDRANGKIPVWDSATNTHVYETPSSSGVPAGTSFPGTPSTGDLFWRTDRALLYYYDGTRWLTVNEYSMPLTGRAFTNISATTTLANMPVRQDYDTYITRIEGPMYTAGGTALSGSHKWVTTFNKIVPDNTPTVFSTLTLDSGAVSTHHPKSDTPGHLVAAASYVQYSIIATKTGTPGNLFTSFELFYRLVG